MSASNRQHQIPSYVFLPCIQFGEKNVDCSSASSSWDSLFLPRYKSRYEVLYRHKMGFPTPLNDWFGGTFRDYAADMLLGSQSTERSRYNAPALEEIPPEKNLVKTNCVPFKVWVLVNVELFCSSYIETDSSGRLV